MTESDKNFFLALAFAKSKLDYALANDLIPPSLAPSSIAETDFFLDEFNTTLDYISNVETEDVTE